ncbi:hypothetical protein KAU86_00095 [bacterium]|nr:hypothetical protein [bacterium]MCK4436329.1 hypothetical protein [bacterium]
MRNKKLERKIVLLKEFIDEWIRFRDFLKGDLKDSEVSAEEERKFLEIKSLIARKYQGLVQALGEEFSPDNRITEIISQAVSLEGLAGTSGMRFGKIENDWHQSYIRLNEFLGGLESQRDQIAKISRVSLIFGGLSRAVRGLLRGVIKLILVLVLLTIIGLFGSYFLAGEEAKEKGLVGYVITTVKDWTGMFVEGPEESE